MLGCTQRCRIFTSFTTDRRAFWFCVFTSFSAMTNPVSLCLADHTSPVVPMPRRRIFSNEGAELSNSGGIWVGLVVVLVSAFFLDENEGRLNVVRYQRSNCRIFFSSSMCFCSKFCRPSSCRFLLLTPTLMSMLMMSRLLAFSAISMQVPSRPCACTSAPYLMSELAICVWPHRQAHCSGVMLRADMRLGLAPHCSRNSVPSSFWLNTALYSGVSCRLL
mmetsp:Transcript_1951/g.4496  ORF Transcript_1951/g.4496 Transcript_1951/m.4496 type:complete len:219 (-) Transcript_1951:261-917(-)